MADKRIENENAMRFDITWNDVPVEKRDELERELMRVCGEAYNRVVLGDTSKSLQFRINIDAEPAVKSLKSITRAAKEAMQACREVEKHSIIPGAPLTEETVSRLRRMLGEHRLPVAEVEIPMDGVWRTMTAYPIFKPLSEHTTVELHEELAKREGVRELIYSPGTTCEVKSILACGMNATEVFTGPMRILVNQD